MGGNSFAPNAPLTRQDFATMLWNQAGNPKMDLYALERFRDQEQDQRLRL